MRKLSTTFFLVVAVAFGAVPAAQAASVSPEAISGATTIDAGTAKELFDRGLTFVDVRSDADWEEGRVPGAIHLELKKVFSQDTLGEIVKTNDPVVFYCNGPKCMRSSKACTQSVAWGYSEVYYFRGGFPAWVEAGFVVE